jgi:hypothetical protein
MSRKDENLWIREGADRGEWRDAERARLNRREIQHALWSGEISRRDLVKWGLFTGAGLIAPIGGLSPFVGSAHAQTSSAVPTGLPASPTFGVAPLLDRGNEGLNDGINLRLPSESLQDFANLEYDINLMFADKAWDSNGQLDMDTAEFNGFLGDQMTVNLAWKPFN